MMDLLLATSGGESQSASGGYVDDVFSAYTYTGNGSTQTINNGIDLAGNGGLVWIKHRESAENHCLFDTARGITNSLNTNTTNAQNITIYPPSGVSSVSSSGFALGSGEWPVNQNTKLYASWTFRKARKFFDVVTWTGNGSSIGNITINHNLGASPGMVIIKATGEADNWYVWHRSADTVGGLLNGTGAFSGSTDLLLLSSVSSASITTHPSNMFTNKNGISYVAYLFAHDPSADGIIQCGSFTTDGSANATVNLGWEPQYLIVKTSSVSQGWYICDTSRNLSVTSSYSLQANSSGAENPVDTFLEPTATGFKMKNWNSNANHIYLAIRRPNKPPTTGTQVYNAIARTGTGAAATVTGVGFAPDLVISKVRNSTEFPSWFDRLRGKFLSLISSAANAETSLSTSLIGFSMDGASYGTDSTGIINASGATYINHFFRRATGFFDEVCDTGTGVAHSVNHGLSAAPEFIIRKSRSGATQWEVWHSALAATEKLVLNSNAAKATDATAWSSTLPTSTQFTVGTGANVNTNAATYVTYLFATLAGISKVGSYTGNGTSQTINCGFSTGSRFILVKRTDATGDWYVWDSVRGIIAANDPYLSLNTTAAEVTTDDSVDPDESGFIVNQNTATNINVNGGSYIFLAIA